MGAELRHEVAVLQRLVPGLPIALPPGKPNTRPAIEQAAALLRRERSHGMAFVRETYRAFWCEGRDISDPAALRQLVEQGGGSPESMGTIMTRVAGGSRMGSGLARNRGQAGVLLIVSPEGDLLVGCVPPEEIRRFFA